MYEVKDSECKTCRSWFDLRPSQTHEHPGNVNSLPSCDPVMMFTCLHVHSDLNYISQSPFISHDPLNVCLFVHLTHTRRSIYHNGDK